MKRMRPLGPEALFFQKGNGFHAPHPSEKNKPTCEALGGGVKALTTTRQTRAAIKAGKIASRCASTGGKCRLTASRSQKKVTSVPTAMALTAPWAFARRL